MKLNEQELATVLAALRWYQHLITGKHPTPYNELTAAIHEIATDGGTIEELNAEEIDALCEKINTIGADNSRHFNEAIGVAEEMYAEASGDREISVYGDNCDDSPDDGVWVNAGLWVPKSKLSGYDEKENESHVSPGDCPHGCGRRVAACARSVGKSYCGFLIDLGPDPINQ